MLWKYHSCFQYKKTDWNVNVYKFLIATIYVKYGRINSIIYSCKYLEDFNFQKDTSLSQGKHSNAIEKNEISAIISYILSYFIHWFMLLPKLFPHKFQYIAWRQKNDFQLFFSHLYLSNILEHKLVENDYLVFYYACTSKLFLRIPINYVPMNFLIHAVVQVSICSH